MEEQDNVFVVILPDDAKDSIGADIVGRVNRILQEKGGLAEPIPSLLKHLPEPHPQQTGYNTKLQQYSPEGELQVTRGGDRDELEKYADIYTEVEEAPYYICTTQKKFSRVRRAFEELDCFVQKVG
ncbi:MAG: hypothetical protein ABIH34_02685 [Nanoarchaeota archaeon]